MKKILYFIKNKINQNKNYVLESTHKDEEVHDWMYDRYQMQVVIANRWQLAFWMELIFCLLLILGLIMLLPLKQLIPLIINRNIQTGEVWVEQAKDNTLPQSLAETESDLVRYIVSRETYSSVDINQRYHQVLVESSPSIADDYKHSLDQTSPQSPINIFGQNGIRTVKIQDIVFLDQTQPNKINSSTGLHHLAKIDFTTIETKDQQISTKYWVATVRWDYLGLPNSKEAAWLNWNGFTVTYYRVDQRNI